MISKSGRKHALLPIAQELIACLDRHGRLDLGAGETIGQQSDDPVSRTTIDRRRVMAGALRKTMKYLGMADGDREYEDEYEEYADYEEVVEEPMDSYEAQVTPISRAFSHQEPSGFANTELRRITTVHPRSYNDARVIGEAFRDGTPVIMNLSDMDDADAKRLVDFSAGLIFGLQGNIERVTSKVFLLSPANLEISGESSDQSASSSSTQSFYNQS